jgi:hypothetical protein
LSSFERAPIRTTIPLTAREEALPEVWLQDIAASPDMRFWVAQNKMVPVRILEILAGDPDATVRGMVASKRKLPEELQILLAGDPDGGVRDRLANNAKATIAALQKIAEGATGIAAKNAARRLRAWASIARCDGSRSKHL